MTITENTLFNGIELYFDTIPNKNIITALKDKKFKWHSVKKCWYAKATQENKDFAYSLTDAKEILTANTNNNNNKKETAKETPQSQYRYCYNGIYTENGEYIKASYHIDIITSEIYLFLDTYKMLHNAPAGTYQQNDSDIMTDYFDKTTLYITPQSKEYINALTGYKKQWEHEEKQKEKWALKNSYVTRTTQEQKDLYNRTTAKAEELARNFIELDFDTANKIYNEFVEENKKKDAEEKARQKLEDTKNYIKNLQEDKQKIENGQFCYYDEILENDNYIIAISKQKYNIIDFTPNCMDKTYIDYNIQVIDKNNLIHEHFTTQDANEKDEYIKKYIA